MRVQVVQKFRKVLIVSVGNKEPAESWWAYLVDGPICGNITRLLYYVNVYIKYSDSKKVRMDLSHSATCDRRILSATI